MAEKILLGNSYQKDLYLTSTDEYGNQVPIDLSKYDDCYVAIKKDRYTPDEESYLLKKIEPVQDQEGTIILYFSPEETATLPLTSIDMPYLWMFIQLGSTATGETIEVGAYKVKTTPSGIKYYTEQDTTLNDLGYIKGYVGFVFDCGGLCSPTVLNYDVSGGEPYITDCGYLKTNGQYEIWDLGSLSVAALETIDLEYLEKDCK